MMQRKYWLAALAFVAAYAPRESISDTPESGFDLGVGALLLLGNGEPSNDMPSIGLTGRYRLNQQWSIGLSWHTGEWDFERPAKLLDLDPSEEVDSLIDEQSVSIWVESQFAAPLNLVAYWQLGGGAASSDASNATGTTVSGSEFNIVTDVGTTPLAFAALGVRREFAGSWYAEAAIRIEYRFADFTFEDTVTGRVDEIDSFSLYGGYVGVGYRF